MVKWWVVWSSLWAGTMFGQTADRSITYLHIDGLTRSIFETELNAGHLPRIADLLSRSTYVEQTVGAFPSMTGYAFYPYLTGRRAIESDVLGLRWFDRSLTKGNLRNYVGRTNVYMNHDINPDIPLIFEHFPDAYTVSINSFMNRGVQKSSNTGWPLTTAKYTDVPLFKTMKRLPIINRQVYNHFQLEDGVMAQAIAQLDANPKVQWVTLAGLDALNHIYGTTPDYAILLQHIDSLVGAFVQAVEDRGQSGRAIALISDHGVRDVAKNHNLPYDLVEQTGIRLRRGASTSLRTMVLDTDITELSDVDGYFVVNGNLSAFVYLTDPNIQDPQKRWANNLPLATLQNYPSEHGERDLINWFSKHPGIAFIAARNADTTMVYSNSGQAKIHRTTDGLCYTYQGADPLELDLSKDSVCMNNEEWFEATLGKAYADGPRALHDLMQHPRMGDLYLEAAAGHDLAADYEILVGNYKGGHGSLHSELTVVPSILYLPGYSPKKIKAAPADEVGRLLLDYMLR